MTSQQRRIRRIPPGKGPARGSFPPSSPRDWSTFSSPFFCCYCDAVVRNEVQNRPCFTLFLLISFSIYPTTGFDMGEPFPGNSSDPPSRRKASARILADAFLAVAAPALFDPHNHYDAFRRHPLTPRSLCRPFRGHAGATLRSWPVFPPDIAPREKTARPRVRTSPKGSGESAIKTGAARSLHPLKPNLLTRRLPYPRTISRPGGVQGDPGGGGKGDQTGGDAMISLFGPRGAEGCPPRPSNRVHQPVSTIRKV